jgi:16S rRNA (uracil1498-N3)-methyltransferase
MQQLFIISTFQKKGNQLFLSSVPDLLAQLRKVFRAKLGDSIFVQSEEGIRYELQITHRTDQDLQGEILDAIPLVQRATGETTTMLVAMPNKWEKAELIVQKLTEIGVDEIFFRPAERSVIKQRNEKKIERLTKIAKEAVEQSRGWSLPTI